MPSVPIPDERTCVGANKWTIHDRDCNIYVYEETHSALFGLFDWNARHVRIEVPYKFEPRVKFIHDTRGRSWPTELPSREEHVEEAYEKAKDWIDRQDDVIENGVS